MSHLLQVEKTLYKVGYDHHMFRFCAEHCWFELGDSPSDAARATFEGLAAAIDHLLAEGQICDGAVDCLRQVRAAARDCWGDLNKNWHQPERLQIVSMMEELEPEFLTDDLWRKHTVLNRLAWKTFAGKLKPLCAAVEQPLSVLLETGSLVAQVQTMGFGSFAVWDREQHPVSELEYALIKLREHYPQLNGVDLEFSDSLLREEQSRTRRTINHAALARAEVIDKALLEGLSVVGVHQADESESSPAESEEDSEKYVLEKLPHSKKIIVSVRFDGETGTMTGSGARRIALIIQQEKVGLKEVSGDLEISTSRSVASLSDLGVDVPVTAATNEFEKLDKDTIREITRSCRQRLEQLEQWLEVENDTAKQAQFQKEQESISDYLAEIDRSVRVESGKAHQRVDRDLRLKREELTVPMPRFAQHLEKSIKFDETKSQYCYRPGPKPSWTFRGFSE